MKNTKKEVVVTGGSRGLGEELCKRLVKDGYKVVNLDIKSPNYSLEGEYEWIKVDLSKDDCYKELRLKIKPDIVINNASVNYIQYVEKINMDRFNQVVKTNINGYVNTIRYFFEDLKEKKGTVLNIVSSAAKNPMTASLTYNTTKAAQLMMTRQLAREFSRENYGITVFAVSPGKIEDSEMSRYVDDIVPKVRGWSKEKSESYWDGKSVMPNKIDKVDLAEQIVTLLNTKHSHLTGCNLEMGIE